MTEWTKLNCSGIVRLVPFRLDFCGPRTDLNWCYGSSVQLIIMAPVLSFEYVHRAFYCDRSRLATEWNWLTDSLQIWTCSQLVQFSSVCVALWTSLKHNRSSSCISSLLPYPRNHDVISRLWAASVYPLPVTCTKRYTSFVNYCLLNYQ